MCFSKTLFKYEEHFRCTILIITSLLKLVYLRLILSLFLVIKHFACKMDNKLKEQYLKKSLYLFLGKSRLFNLLYI